LAFYSASSVEDLTNIIIPHFEKYSLLTQKAADFNAFKNIVELIKNNAHLSIEGLHQIINIKASMNKGLPAVRPSLITLLKLTDPSSILKTFLIHTGYQDLLMEKELLMLRFTAQKIK